MKPKMAAREELRLPARGPHRPGAVAWNVGFTAPWASMGILLAAAFLARTLAGITPARRAARPDLLTALPDEKPLRVSPSRTSVAPTPSAMPPFQIRNDPQNGNDDVSRQHVGHTRRWP